jgi:hypothetical protein
VGRRSDSSDRLSSSHTPQSSNLHWVCGAPNPTSGAPGRGVSGSFLSVDLAPPRPASASSPCSPLVAPAPNVASPAPPGRRRWAAAHRVILLRPRLTPSLTPPSTGGRTRRHRPPCDVTVTPARFSPPRPRPRHPAPAAGRRARRQRSSWRRSCFTADRSARSSTPGWPVLPS